MAHVVQEVKSESWNKTNTSTFYVTWHDMLKMKQLFNLQFNISASGTPNF